MGFVDSVKDLAGKFGESVERGAKTVSNSSKKFAEKTKMKREIARVQSDINTDYIELGKVMFEKICDIPKAITLPSYPISRIRLQILKNSEAFL